MTGTARGRRRALLLTCMFALTVLVACQPKSDVQTVDEYTGTNGITISFDENAPPNTVYDYQPFFASVNLHNKGAYDVNKSTGQVHVSLNTQNLYYLQEIEGTGSHSHELSLRGKSDIRPKGADTSVSFGKFKIPNRTKIGEIQDATEVLQARVCYPYKTTMSDTLCIKNSFNNEQDNPLCRAEQTKTYSGSGSPVAITKIENTLIPVGQAQKAFTKKSLTFNEDGQITGTKDVQKDVTRVKQQPIMRITVENVGNGRPTYDENEVCGPSEQSRANVVRMEAKLGNSSLKCRPKLIHLDNQGKGTTRCIDEEREITLSSNYQTLFNAKLTYTYVNSKAAEINIRQRPGLNS